MEELKEVMANVVPEAKTVPAKYVFLDVVDFSRDRSVEAQTYIVEFLNRVVWLSLSEDKLSEIERLLLPTGDGICIAILNIVEPYDIHIQLALRIVGYISRFQGCDLDEIDQVHADGKERDHPVVHTEESLKLSEMRKFKIRIGVEANIDNLVVDINGKLNIAGAGINMAQRIMGLADGNQILVGQAVFNELRHRETYMTSFRRLHGATVKHNTPLDVYQFIGEGYEGLNTEYPEALKPKKFETPKLTKIAAYYFAHAIRNRKFFVQKYKDLCYAGAVLLWILAKDSIRKSEAVTEPEKMHYEDLYRIKETLEDLYSQIVSTNFQVLEAANKHVSSNVDDYTEFFEDYSDYRFVTENSAERVKHDWPEIWAEMELDSF